MLKGVFQKGGHPLSLYAHSFVLGERLEIHDELPLFYSNRLPVATEYEILHWLQMSESVAPFSLRV